MSESKSLRELVSISSAIRDALSDGGDFDPSAIKALGFTKEETEVALRDKVDAIAFVLDDLNGMASQLKARADINAKSAQQFTKAAERLKEYLKGTMTVFGIQEVSGSDERFKLTPTAMSLIVNDVDALPEFYLVRKTVVEPNKELIKKDLEAMKNVPGAKLEGGMALRRYAVKPKGKK